MKINYMMPTLLYFYKYVLCRTEFFHLFLFWVLAIEVFLLGYGTVISVVVASWNMGLCCEESEKAAWSMLPSGFLLDELRKKVNWWEETLYFISPGKIPRLFLELLKAAGIGEVTAVSVMDWEVPGHGSRADSAQ